MRAHTRFPGKSHRSLLDRPLALFGVLVVTAVAAELAVVLLLPLLPALPAGWQLTLDVAVLVALLAPLLVVLVYRPLRRSQEERERAIVELVQSEQRFRDIADNAREWIWEVDADGRYTYSSAAVADILGYAPEEVLGRPFHELFHPDDRDELREAAARAFARKAPFTGFLNRNVHRDGRTVWLSTSGVPILGERGELLGYRGADIVRYDEAAMTDPLTGLTNRTGFRLLAEQQLRIAQRTQTPLALVFADLDDFKEINDTLGHGEGDRALIDVAEVLRRSVRDSDIVTRLGGDEFVLLLPATTAATAEQVVVSKLHQNVATFNSSSGRPYKIAFSCGVARLDPTEPIELGELLRRADSAMYADKRRRRDSAG